MGRGEGRKRRRTMRKSSDFTRWSTIPRSGEHSAQGEVDCLPHDGGHEEPAGSQLEIPDAQEVPRGGQRVPVPDGTQVPSGAQQMLISFTIGTTNAFKKGYAYEYKKEMIKGETIYVCNKSSEWAHRNKVLVLRCVDRNWTAFDSAFSDDGSIPHCRQPVFRCIEKDITQPGWYYWEFNGAANRHDTDFVVEWNGGMWAETQVP